MTGPLKAILFSLLFFPLLVPPCNDDAMGNGRLSFFHTTRFLLSHIDIPEGRSVDVLRALLDRVITLRPLSLG